MITRKMTCIVCPVGCSLEVQKDDTDIIVYGNKCKRGDTYAKNEMSSPMRTLTSTVRLTNGGVLPIKTSTPIAKDKLFDIIKELKAVIASPPIALNQVIVKNILNLGADIIATSIVEWPNKSL